MRGGFSGVEPEYQVVKDFCERLGLDPIETYNIAQSIAAKMRASTKRGKHGGSN